MSFSLTPEEAMVDDLTKACGTYKIFVLFDENTDLVSNRYTCLYLLQTHLLQIVPKEGKRG